MERVPLITIDYRKGSVDLKPLFEAHRLPHEVGTLPFGDFAFEGNGAKGTSLIGIEYKKVPDLLECLRDGRFVGHQLPGMLEHFDYSYLVIEGITRPEPNSGLLQEMVIGKGGSPWWRDVMFGGRRRFMWRDWDNFITTLEQSRLKVRRVDNAEMTVHTVGSLHHWYTGKQWHEHQSLRALHSAAYPTMTLENKSAVVRRVAKEFVGIGVERSLAVHGQFHTVWDMVTALREEWLRVPGLTPGIVDKVMRQIHGEQDEREREQDRER